MKEAINKLQEWFEPIQEYIIAHYEYIKYGFWGIIAFLILYSIVKDMLGRAK
ncbi:MAG: hypothetical protein ACM3O4_04585 [Ignavibacteriales bacterium]